jgi:hypothetical protein
LAEVLRRRCLPPWAADAASAAARAHLLLQPGRQELPRLPPSFQSSGCGRAHAPGGPSSTSRALATSRKRTDASAAGRRGGGERTSSSTAHQPDVRSPTSTRSPPPSTLQTSWLLTRLVVSRECSDRIGEPDILLDVSGVPDSGAIDLVEGLLSLGLSQLEPRGLGSHPVHLPQRLGG